MSRLLLFRESAVELHVIRPTSGLIRSVRLEAEMVDEFKGPARAAEATASCCSAAPSVPSRCTLDRPGEGGRRHAGSRRKRRIRCLGRRERDHAVQFRARHDPFQSEPPSADRLVRRQFRWLDRRPRGPAPFLERDHAGTSWQQPLGPTSDGFEASSTARPNGTTLTIPIPADSSRPDPGTRRRTSTQAV